MVTLEEYCAPTFDPASVIVPRLRSILVEQNVQYPSSAKKPDLIDLFNRNVVPNAPKLLAAQARVRRSARGIVDVPSSQEATADGDEDDENEMSPPPVPESGRRASRRSARTTMGDESVRTPTARLTTGTPFVRRSSSKHARTSDAEQDVETAAKRLAPIQRRPRQSMSPAVNAGEADVCTRDQEESPFSSDNPFQSGISPQAEARSASSNRRRTTLGPAGDKERRKSAVLRRKTDNYNVESIDDGVVVPSSKTFEMSVAHIQKKPLQDQDFQGAGEEFTPEEQLALVRERAKSGQVDILPPRRRRPQQSTGVARVAPWAVLLAMLGGLATVWRQEKLQVGYCGVGRQSTALAGVQIPDWASIIQPGCEPCPQHAICYPDLQTRCEPDFVIKPHPLSFGGLVPLPPTCEPDGDKARRVKAVADRAVEELRERNAKWECGDLVDENGHQSPAPELDEVELKQKMSDKRRKGMSQEEFEDLWKGAIPEITGREEITSAVDGASGHRTLRSNSQARVPLNCAIRRSIRLALARHLWQLVGALLFLASGGYARLSITSGRETEARAKQLASFALDRLATQAALHAQDSGAYPEAWISMGQLRDDVLRAEFSASRRQKLWEKVQKKVEQNSNVRPMVRESRTGDVSRVWEWIGAVGLLEGTPGSGDRRQSSRRSLIASSPGHLTPLKGEDGTGEMSEIRTWDEGRPIY
ncbi:hypothetical protein LTR04_006889 [Oleoguttula sp. CCFEE 6159]|nr:hypothetical protein LTR04_006889 [Oleoguttula sp. CCFEE 6159]